MIADYPTEYAETYDPSPDDGSWGGDFCRHGRYIGTPGGADYMCQLCELGFDRWVADPLWGVMLTFGKPADGPVQYRRVVWWRESDGIEKAWGELADVAASWEAYATLPAGGATLYWEAAKFDEGYWDC